MRALRFRFDVHRTCEVVSTRQGGEAILAFDPHQEGDSITWFDQYARGRPFPVAAITRDEPDDLRFLSVDGTAYRLLPLTVERYRKRVLPRLGASFDQWAPSGDTELDRLQLDEYLRTAFLMDRMA